MNVTVDPMTKAASTYTTVIPSGTVIGRSVQLLERGD